MKDDVFIFRWIAQDSRGNNKAAEMGVETVKKPPPAFSHYTGRAERSVSSLGERARQLASLVLQDIPAKDRQTMAVFLGTMRGAREEDLIFQRSRKNSNGKYSSPAAFSRTLPSTVAAELTIEFGIRGPLLVFTAGAASGLLASVRAIRWIQSGNISLALTGALDWSHADDCHNTIYSTSYSPQILFYLIGRRSALPGIYPMIQIKQGQLKYSSAQNKQRAIASITHFVNAFRLASTQRVNIQEKSGIGTLCQIIMGPV